MPDPRPVPRRVFLAATLASVTLLGACVGTFRTWYETPVSPEVSRGWRVTSVEVEVPSNLVVNEKPGLMPSGDIVWREDPPGDRRAQVAAIVRTAAGQAVSGLSGPRPVTLYLTVSRFHALTFEAETRLANAGVHNVDLVARVTDAASGEVLAGPEVIEAALPALAGAEMVAARLRGETQKSQITAHLRQTIASWIGVGPDIRGSFRRAGG